MLNSDERGEFAEVAADYLDALQQRDLYGPAAAGELAQSEALLVSLLARLMQEHRVNTFTCLGCRFALLRRSGQRVLHISRLNPPAARVGAARVPRFRFAAPGATIRRRYRGFGHAV